MNNVFIDVYLKKKSSRWGRGREGTNPDQMLSLDDILIGDPIKRGDNRDTFVSRQIDEYVKKVIKD